jgi:2-amino-4-hydroxy-6-hydroxymethyldihydropteridine diphosphokinase
MVNLYLHFSQIRENDSGIFPFMKKHIAYICVGSNVGNKLEYCQKGIAALVRSGSTEIQAQSRIYKTNPVDYQQQDWFVNYAVKAATVLDPFQLLSELKSI